jgi:hypothetical protein
MSKKPNERQSFYCPYGSSYFFGNLHVTLGCWVLCELLKEKRCEGSLSVQLTVLVNHDVLVAKFGFENRLTYAVPWGMRVVKALQKHCRFADRWR